MWYICSFPCSLVLIGTTDGPTYCQIGVGVGLYRVGNFKNLHIRTVSFMKILSIFIFHCCYIIVSMNVVQRTSFRKLECLLLMMCVCVCVCTEDISLFGISWLWVLFNRSICLTLGNECEGLPASNLNSSFRGQVGESCTILKFSAP